MNSSAALSVTNRNNKVFSVTSMQLMEARLDQQMGYCAAWVFLSILLQRAQVSTTTSIMEDSCHVVKVECPLQALVFARLIPTHGSQMVVLLKIV